MKADTDDAYVTVNVAGEPPRTRTPEKDEKAQERERRDKDYAETLKRLDERVAREKALARWTYVVQKSAVEPLLREREQMVAQKKKEEKPALKR